MKYSVIVPVYNTEKYVAECIESVLAQSYQDWELFLIDDGSKDNSASICKSYINKDSRIHLFCKNNGGPLEARKVGIGHATGQYCLFLDSDDYWDKNLLEEVNQTIEREDTDIVIFNMKQLYQNTIVKAPFIQKDVSLAITGQEMIERMLEDIRLGSMAIKAVKREKLLVANEMIHTESRHGEDLYQSIALMCCSQNISILESPLYYYRQRKTSSVHGEKYGKIKQHFQVMKEINELLQECNKLDDTYTHLMVQLSLIYIAEYIFKQNNYKCSWMQKREKLVEELNDYDMVEILKYRKRSKLIFYQKIRLHLYERKCFIILIAVDSILMLIKNTLNKIRNQVMFE